jgi:hypothetical protein
MLPALLAGLNSRHTNKPYNYANPEDDLSKDLIAVRRSGSKGVP